MLRDTLIIQFRTDGRIQDYDWLIKIENALTQGFSQNRKGIVDGHDFGSGNMNIFIFPTQGWTAAIEIAKAYLQSHEALDRSIIIKRTKKEKYTVVWPQGFSGEYERL